MRSKGREQIRQACTEKYRSAGRIDGGNDYFNFQGVEKGTVVDAVEFVRQRGRFGRWKIV